MYSSDNWSKTDVCICQTVSRQNKIVLACSFSNHFGPDLPLLF